MTCFSLLHSTSTGFSTQVEWVLRYMFLTWLQDKLNCYVRPHLCQSTAKRSGLVDTLHCFDSTYFALLKGSHGVKKTPCKKGLPSDDGNVSLFNLKESLGLHHGGCLLLA